MDWLDAISKIFELVVATSTTAFLSAVGLLLLAIAAALAYSAVKSKPEELSTFMKICLFFTLVGGTLFSAAGPGLALFYVSQQSIPQMSKNRAFDNLEKNQEVKYVVRLISFNPAEEPDLEIDRLTHLGPPDQMYTFVASHDELVGHTVKTAYEKVGLRYVDGHHVSAIIFPLRTSLFPANARGLLQVVRDVEIRKSIEQKDKFFQGLNSLNDGENADLDITTIESYRIDNFKSKYYRYCEVAKRFNCEAPHVARKFIGGLYRDWHPLGFSQTNPPQNPCNIPVDKYCEFSDWKATRSALYEKFGSRSFLIRNLQIDRIFGRMLIDFDKPETQVIPSMGTRQN
jgi:hypothetical protein